MATLSGATRSPQATSRLFPDVLRVPSRSPNPALELGLYVWLPAGRLRSGATQGPQTPEGPSWCHRFPPLCPLLLVVILPSVKLPKAQAPSPLSRLHGYILVILHLIGLSSALSLSSSFGSHFGRPGHAPHLLPGSLHHLLDAPHTAAPGSGLSSQRHEHAF